MPTWQIIISASMLMFASGAAMIVASRRRETLLAAYGAWSVAVPLMGIAWLMHPAAFTPVLDLLGAARRYIAWPPIAIALIGGLLLMAFAVVMLMEKNARLLRIIATPGDIRLGSPAPLPQPARSPLRRFFDRAFARQPIADDCGLVFESPSAADSLNDGGAVWKSMLKNQRIRDAFRITPEDEQTLARVSFMGKVSSPHDLRLVLEVLRSARASLGAEIEGGAAPDALSRQQSSRG